MTELRGTSEEPAAAESCDADQEVASDMLRDYECYADHKALLHLELVCLKEGARLKICEVLFSNFTQAGLLLPGGGTDVVQRPVLSGAVSRVIPSDSPRRLPCFPDWAREVAEL